MNSICTCSLRLVCAKEVKYERQAREEETENETHSTRLLYKQYVAYQDNLFAGCQRNFICAGAYVFFSAQSLTEEVMLM